MSRPLRIQGAGLTYHVTARGVRRASIYLDDIDRRRFLTLLAEVVERYALICHAYCEMTNHYHLAVTTRDANLSRAVRQLNGRYAQWWNWRHQRTGHVFQARFHAQIVQDEVYLANLCRYIVLNPVRAGIVGTPGEWKWSSYRATAGLARAPRFLDLVRLLAVLAPDNPADAARLFHQSALKPDADALPLPRHSILGDDAFVARFARSRAQADREVVVRDARRRLESIFQAAVTRPLRNAAIIVAVEERFSLADIARYLGVHPSTVSKVVSSPGVRS